MKIINAISLAELKRITEKIFGELVKANEQFAKSFLTDEIDNTLEKYFMDFAITERLTR